MSSREVSLAFGYMTFGELEKLGEFALLVRDHATIVNVGSGSGTSGLCLAEVRPEAERYTVDISPGGPLGGLENERNAFVGSGLPLPVQLLGDSYSIGKNWRGAPIDLLFIDADHSCKGILRDLRAWLPHMNPISIVAFHDYGSPNWPCVKRVVDKVFANCLCIGNIDTLIGFTCKPNWIQNSISS